MRRGFSLTELLVVVAIIAVLSAIAIPAWTTTQHMAKRAEVPSNVDAIRVAELSYHAAHDTFVAEGSWYPQALGLGSDKELKAWPAADSAGGFSTIGWVPHGEVRGAYSIPVGDETTFEVQGACDVDGDGDSALYWCTESEACGWDAGDEGVF